MQSNSIVAPMLSTTKTNKRKQEYPEENDLLSEQFGYHYRQKYGNKALSPLDSCIDDFNDDMHVRVKPPTMQTAADGPSVVATMSALTMNNLDIKECPSCHVLTQKNGGCNHMTCSLCNADWSWRSGLVMQEHQLARTGVSTTACISATDCGTQSARVTSTAPNAAAGVTAAHRLAGYKKAAAIRAAARDVTAPHSVANQAIPASGGIVGTRELSDSYFMNLVVQATQQSLLDESCATSLEEDADYQYDSISSEGESESESDSGSGRGQAQQIALAESIYANYINNRNNAIATTPGSVNNIEVVMKVGEALTDAVSDLGRSIQRIERSCTIFTAGGYPRFDIDKVSFNNNVISTLADAVSLMAEMSQKFVNLQTRLLTAMTMRGDFLVPHKEKKSIIKDHSNKKMPAGGGAKKVLRDKRRK